MGGAAATSSPRQEGEHVPSERVVISGGAHGQAPMRLKHVDVQCVGFGLRVAALKTFGWRRLCTPLAITSYQYLVATTFVWNVFQGPTQSHASTQN